MTVTTLASGSSGNCALISTAEGAFLLDAGISCRRIKQALDSFGLSLQQLKGVLITHEHSDHVSALSTFCKQCAVPLYCSVGTAWQLLPRLDIEAERIFPVMPGQPFSLAGLQVEAFPLSHDAAEPVGYFFREEGKKLCFVTDLGRITSTVLRAVAGTDLLFVEANYDEAMLRSGPYPPALKQRIAGTRGHLSNTMGAELAKASGCRRVVLAHLSRENNTPHLAQDTVQRILGPGVEVDVAPRQEPGKRYEL